MPSTIPEQKEALRCQVQQQLAAMPDDVLRRSDDALFARFLSIPQVERAKTIFAFWGVPGKEPDTAKLIVRLLAAGKRVGLPQMLPKRGMQVRQFDTDRPLVPVAFGLSEPGEDCPLLPREEIDLILVPAVCYDRLGYRLGFGGGYYDRWLEHDTTFRVGLCRQAVLQQQVPIQEYDSRVDLLVTEDMSLDCRD